MDTYTVIYLLSAVAGMLIYNYAGYLKYGKPSGESFDFGKWLNTFLTGGGSSSALTYVFAQIIPSGGFDWYLFGGAFIMGLFFSAGIDTTQDILSPKKTALENSESALDVLKRIEGKLSQPQLPQAPAQQVSAASPTAPNGPLETDSQAPTP